MAEQNYDPFSGFMDAKPSSKKTRSGTASTEKKSGTSVGNTGGWMVYSAPQVKKLPKSLRAKRPRDADKDGDAPEEATGDEWRSKHNITLEGDFKPEPILQFKKLPAWTKPIQGTFTAQGFTAPTPIQSQAWPIVLGGRDIVGIAKTGSGKTLAFMVPAIKCLQASGEKAKGPKVLVLAPTRELAQQIQTETNKVLPASCQCSCIFGGTPKRPQAEELRKLPEVVIATPGRLIDFVTGKVMSLASVQYLVLDEADRMLDMGFEPQVREIVCKIPEEQRQTMMFSATWPKEVQKMAQQFQNDPVQLRIGSTELRANPDITQKFLFVQNDMEKVVEVRKIIGSRANCRIIIFVNMKSTADHLDGQLRRCGIESQAIHGEKDQAQRDYILHRFKTNTSGVLVATDVAGRGIDIKNLEVVINYDFPGTLDDYVHRIGRTGRAGAKGLAVTLLGNREKSFNAHVAAKLKDLLVTAGQEVPPQIKERADMASLVVRPPAVKTNGKGVIIPYKHSSKPSGSGSVKKKKASSDGPKMMFGQAIS